MVEVQRPQIFNNFPLTLITWVDLLQLSFLYQRTVSLRILLFLSCSLDSGLMVRP